MMKDAWNTSGSSGNSLKSGKHAEGGRKLLGSTVEFRDIKEVGTNIWLNNYQKYRTNCTIVKCYYNFKEVICMVIYYKI